MQKDPFVILGVSSEVTQNELYEAYKKARAEWEPKRFAIGEEGAIACEKLDEIEQAYRDADEIIKSRYFVTTCTDVYRDVEKLIKDKNFDGADAKLDGLTERNAEWYFLKSVVCCGREQFAEGKSYLEKAIELDPFNSKYNDGMRNVTDRIAREKAAKNRQAAGGAGYERSNVYAYRDDNERSYRDDGYSRMDRGITPCDCCSSLICADCCCECMGGDLIACC